MAGKLQDLTGQVFGELTVVALHSKKAGSPTQWTCECSCGNRTNVQAPRLKSGKTTSCGHKRVKHGMHGTPTYRSWNAMQQRCLNPKNDNYHKYGAVGVTVCDKWLTFEGFYAEMGVRPEGCTLNRIGSAKVYSKGTCEWATLGVQSFDQVIDKRNNLGIKEVRFRKDRLKWEARITVDKVKHLLYYGNDYFEACCLRKAAELKYY